MVISCCAVGCNNKQGNPPGLSFYRFPADKERREQWIAAVNRADFSPNDTTRLCSAHFIRGKKDNNPLSPDYVPQIFSHVSSPKKKAAKRAMENFERRQNMKRRRIEQDSRKEAASGLLSLALTGTESDDSTDSTDSDLPQHLPEKDDSKNTGTIMTMNDIASLESECQSLRTKCQDLKEQCDNLKWSEKGFEKNDAKVKYYTGLPSYALLIIIFNFIKPYLKELESMTKFQQLLLTLMRLRLNLNVQDLAFRFNVHVSTASRIFKQVIDVCYHRLTPAYVLWPDREIVRQTLPLSFRKSFPKCISIIDCFEIFIERPSDLDARNKTYSHYKSHNTIKYLISIAPQGAITFISKGWGGRVSDKYLTENSSFLDKINPGDVILADRGFDISDSVGLHCAKVEIPAFTKGKKQLSMLDVEKTRNIAAVRIHVERVIGATRQKYTMLQGTIPITLLQNDSLTNLTTLDKIVHVACALINASESVVPFE